MINAVLFCSCFLIISITYYIFKRSETTIVTEISYVDAVSDAEITNVNTNLSKAEYIRYVSEFKALQESKKISNLEIKDYIL